MKELIDSIVEYIDSEMNIPVNPFVSPANLATYYEGMDMLNTYRGHPRVLAQSLKIFENCGSMPLALIGIGAVIVSASYIQGDRYEPAGIELAKKWFNEAKNIASDPICQIEAQLQEIFILINVRKLKEARPMLDLIANQAKTNFGYYVAELRYWSKQSNREQVESWYSLATTVANSNMQALFLLNKLSYFYLDNNLYKDYIRIAKKIVDQDPGDPWVWHNMSLAYCEIEKYKEAKECNKTALELMDFQAAHNMATYIKHQQYWWWYGWSDLYNAFKSYLSQRRRPD